MTSDDQAAEMLWRGLSACLRLNPEATMATVTHWLEHHGAGFPDVALLPECVRDDAKLWSASASQPELEAYLAAAIMELDGSPLTVRAGKRLAALGWKTMDAVSKDGFKEWIGKQNG